MQVGPCNQLDGYCKSEMCNFLMAPIQAIFFLRSRKACYAFYTDDAWSGLDFYRICYLGHQEDILKSNRFGWFFRIKIEIKAKI